MNCGWFLRAARLASSSRPGPAPEPLVRDLELDGLVPRLPVHFRIAVRQRREHRHALADGGPQHRKWNLELRHTPCGAPQPRVLDSSPLLRP